MVSPTLGKRIFCDFLVQFSGIGLIGDYSDFLTAQQEQQLWQWLNGETSQIGIVTTIKLVTIDCPLFFLNFYD